MKPLTVCFCQPVSAIISCNVAPPARSSMSRTIACLLNARGTRGVLAAALAFFAGLGAAPGGQFQLRFNGAGMFPSQKLQVADPKSSRTLASMGPGCFHPRNSGAASGASSAEGLQWGRDVSIPEMAHRQRQDM